MFMMVHHKVVRKPIKYIKIFIMFIYGFALHFLLALIIILL